MVNESDLRPKRRQNRRTEADTVGRVSSRWIYNQYSVQCHGTVRVLFCLDYEEDFEADDEGPADEAKEVKSPSPCDKNPRPVQARVASGTDDDEAEGGCTLLRSAY